jgi:hypothetical protein
MIGVIEPASPTTPIFSGDGVCTRGATFDRFVGCFTPVAGSYGALGDNAVCR